MLWTLFIIAIGTVHADSFLNHPDLDHLRHDIKEQYYVDIDELDKQAQDFLMFQAHDYDQNLKMDGLELLSALVHDHHYSSPEEEAKFARLSAEEKRIHWQRQFENNAWIIDEALNQHDTNKDGFISLSEYMASLKELKK